MPNLLSDIVMNKQAEIDRRKQQIAEDELVRRAVKCDGRFARALTEPGINLICEMKPRSPSAGVLQANFNPELILSAYNQYATAISVLTDEKYFGGSISLLSQAAANSPLPILCKDFILEPYQCFEARAAGAHAVLLIVKILPDDVLKLLHDTIIALGMAAAVEVQNDDELARVLALDARTILINNRNLDTFAIDLNTSLRLIPKIPSGITVISASGFSSAVDLEKLLPICHNFLIGSALMQSENLSEKLRQFKYAKQGENMLVGAHRDAPASGSQAAPTAASDFEDGTPAV